MDKEFKDNKIQDAGETGFDIPEELKKLPTKPGVYLMHGPKDEIFPQILANTISGCSYMSEGAAQ